ncbi:uncharacterized protein PAC_19341 [Phialocephala subalpina]|uniref:Xylanolytic transcriptional activator regulatory domain-containing protein n=1 Tax=Phialocephala subalpina TaxID=576137 RepID=A0A1L7XWL2_9HELO|nr:uncharacterized protein PAC_19341 [Phialocephala subalpina]
MESLLQGSLQGDEREMEGGSQDGIAGILKYAPGRDGPNQSEVQLATGQIGREIPAARLYRGSDLTASVQRLDMSSQPVILSGPRCFLQEPYPASYLSTNGHQPSTPDWTHTALNDVFSRRIFKPLPPKFHALALINEAFDSFHNAFPIFDQTTFMEKFTETYSLAEPSDSCSDTAWWASLNVVLALAHRFRAMRTRNAHSEDREAWGYLKNALALVTELTLLSSSLLAVQALLGMAIVAQGTPNPRPCEALIAVVLRLAQSMGLHRRVQKEGLSDDDRELRKRVFWIAYFLDKDINFKTGRPPVQDDEDMDVELPVGTAYLYMPGEVRDREIDFFSLRIGVAIIQGQIYKRLCSVNAERQSEMERAVAVRELEAMLETWKRSVPIDFQADYIGTEVLTQDLPTLLHMVIIRSTYFNSLDIIHQYSPRNTEWHFENTLRAYTV